MKINFFDDDPRLISDPDYRLRMGSFGVVAYYMNKALQENDSYENQDNADWVGKCGSLDPQFKYKNKKSFYINVWETNNTLPYYLLQNARGQTMFGLCDKTTKLWQKYGFQANTIYGGCDTNYWHQTKEKNKNQFIFCHVNHATVRSGLDVIIPAFAEKFKNNNDVKLIIKDSGGWNDKLYSFIQSHKTSNIEYINEFWTFDQIRDLYSESHVCLNLLRSTSFGMPLLECSACNTLCLTGDATPTNELVDSSFAVLVPPNGEIPIYPYINQIDQKAGLKNYYGNFQYPEMPYFWNFDVETVGKSMLKVYNNWSFYKNINTRQPVIEKWKWEFSAKKLISILKNYEMAAQC